MGKQIDLSAKADGDTEQNSGVEFPGESMEPLLEKALLLNQINLTKYKYFVCEFKENQSDSFAFKYTKKELTIGTCEWCNSLSVLNYVCKCGLVKYCNEECWEKDRKYHQDKCLAN